VSLVARNSLIYIYLKEMIMKILFVLIFKGEMREKNKNENDFCKE
jgi:hypothetical protein